jgi:hypothetical protein
MQILEEMHCHMGAKGIISEAMIKKLKAHNCHPATC